MKTVTGKANRALNRTLATLLVVAGVLAPAYAQDEEAVAIVGGQTLTLADVEASISGQLADLDKQRQKLVEAAIGPLVDQRLVEIEAAEFGISADQLLSAEVQAKIPLVTSADVDLWFEGNKARLQPGTTKEQVTDQIRALLERERGEGLYRTYLSSLRDKHETRILFEPARTEFDLADATWKGAEDAPITLVEFSDFQCPACRGFNPVLEQLLEKYPEDVKVAFLQFPLRSIHPQAQGAAEAALCARDAGKFWEMHDEMFADQSNLGLDSLKASARKVGIDGAAFDACLDGNKYTPVVQADFDRARGAGITGTPAVFINGREIAPGRVPSLEALSSVLEDELRRSRPADG